MIVKVSDGHGFPQIWHPPYTQDPELEDDDGQYAYEPPASTRASTMMTATDDANSWLSASRSSLVYPRQSFASTSATSSASSYAASLSSRTASGYDTPSSSIAGEARATRPYLVKEFDDPAYANDAFEDANFEVSGSKTRVDGPRDGGIDELDTPPAYEALPPDSEFVRSQYFPEEIVVRPSADTGRVPRNDYGQYTQGRDEVSYPSAAPSSRRDPPPREPQPAVAYPRDASNDGYGPPGNFVEPRMSQRRQQPAQRALRSTSEPALTPSPDERPQLPRRGNTSPHSRPKPSGLDSIDELDETAPLGIPLHHGGPYEVLANLSAGPQLPSSSRDDYLLSSTAEAANRSISDFPQPIPYSLNLNPGEYLPRSAPFVHPLPPNPSRTPLAPIISLGERSPYREQSQSYVPKPASAYENANANRPMPTGLSKIAISPSRQHSRNASLPSANLSWTDSRQQLVASPSSVGTNSSGDLLLRDRRYHPPDAESRISPSIHSRNASSTRLDGPPSSASLLRPKRLVMPAPLQQSAPVLGPSQSTHSISDISVPPQAAIQTRATHIPIHDSKKNLLKKKSSVGPPGHHFLPVEVGPIDVEFPVPLANTNVVKEPPRVPRRLSKRKNY